jgi:hypothetical protein
MLFKQYNLFEFWNDWNMLICVILIVPYVNIFAIIWFIWACLIIHPIQMKKKYKNKKD